MNQPDLIQSRSAQAPAYASRFRGRAAETSGVGVGFGGGGGRKPWQRSLPGNGARCRRERAKRSCAGAAAAVKPPLLRREASKRDLSGTCGPERSPGSPSGATVALVLAVILSTYKSTAVTKLPGALGAVTF